MYFLLFYFIILLFLFENAHLSTFEKLSLIYNLHTCSQQGRIRGGGAPGARPPKIGKNMIFLHKIVIFHTKYPKNVRASLRSAQFFLSAPP